jgi:hypothetical protein
VTAVSPGRLLTPREVARLFGVSRGSVGHWRRQGRLVPAVITPGGTNWYAEDDVRALLSLATTPRGKVVPLGSLRAGDVIVVDGEECRVTGTHAAFRSPAVSYKGASRSGMLEVLPGRTARLVRRAAS